MLTTTRRDALLSFLIPIAVAIVLRVGWAVEFAVRPDGWTGFGGPERHWGLMFDDFGWTLALIAPVAALAYLVLRLRQVRGKLVNAAAILLALPVAVGLFCVDIGETQARLVLHRAAYNAQVASRSNTPVVVFDWGETSRLFMGRQKYYLAFLRGDARHQVETYRTSTEPEAGKLLDADDIRSLLANAWPPHDVERRFRLLKLDSCRLTVRRLSSDYYYLRDDC